MNDILVNQVVQIPLVHRADVAAISNDLSGFELTPWIEILGISKIGKESRKLFLR